MIGFPVILIVQGQVVWISLKAGAEIIRLRKKQNGILYEGEISTGQATMLICKFCGVTASPEHKYY
jgi:hypothetical protein